MRRQREPTCVHMGVTMSTLRSSRISVSMPPVPAEHTEQPKGGSRSSASSARMRVACQRRAARYACDNGWPHKAAGRPHASPFQCMHGPSPPPPAAGASRPCSSRMRLRMRCTARGQADRRGAGGWFEPWMVWHAALKPGGALAVHLGAGSHRDHTSRPLTRRRRVALALDVWDGAPLLLQAMQRAGYV